MDTTTGGSPSEVQVRPRRGAHTTARLSEAVNKHLKAYALAAAAAGVGLLPTARPAEAVIIYTKANVSFHGDFDQVFLAVNRDGINSGFGISDFGEAISGAVFGRVGADHALIGHGGVVKLNAGELIGASGYFGAGLMAKFSVGLFGREFSFFSGPWAGKGSALGFLGIELNDSNFQPHFGWAELRIQPHISMDGKEGYDGTVIGYAYQTVSNESIRAGQGNLGTPEPGTLGLLALGSLGLGFWRRKKQGIVVTDNRAVATRL